MHNLDLPPFVFHVRLMKRTWLSNPDWLCTISHERSQSTGEALSPDLAYEIALAKAKQYVPTERKPFVPFDLTIDL